MSQYLIYRNIPQYGGFLKWGDPQIIHFSRIFHEISQPAIGVPPFMEASICLPSIALSDWTKNLRRRRGTPCEDCWLSEDPGVFGVFGVFVFFPGGVMRPILHPHLLEGRNCNLWQKWADPWKVSKHMPKRQKSSIFTVTHVWISGCFGKWVVLSSLVFRNQGASTWEKISFKAGHSASTGRWFCLVKVLFYRCWTNLPAKALSSCLGFCRLYIMNLQPRFDRSYPTNTRKIGRYWEECGSLIFWNQYKPITNSHPDYQQCEAPQL